MEVPGLLHVNVVSRFHLSDHFLLKPRGQTGCLRVDPRFKLLTSFEKLGPTRRVAASGIPAHLVVSVAQFVLEPVGDPYALEIHLAQPRPRLLGLLLGGQGHGHDQRPQQPDSQTERRQPQFELQVHTPDYTPIAGGGSKPFSLAPSGRTPGLPTWSRSGKTSVIPPIGSFCAGHTAPPLLLGAVIGRRQPRQRFIPDLVTARRTTCSCSPLSLFSNVSGRTN